MEREPEIVTGFREKFSDLKHVPVALYGLGTNTGILVKHLNDFRIVSLVANDHIGEAIYGYRVDDIQTAIKKAKTVIIVAQLTSVRIIYNRIREIEKQGVCIYDLSGNQLTGQQDLRMEEKRTNPYWKSSKKDLLEQIDRYDVISFDIFDTLIMRKVLMPSHVFDLVEYKEKKYSKTSFQFKVERMSAEKELILQEKNATIHEIYAHLQKRTGITDRERDRLMHLEIETEKELLVPRREMVECLRYAKAKGKKVCLISDMYMTKPLMEEVLAVCGIEKKDYDELFVSCDYRQSKYKGGLYDVYHEAVLEERKLHVGDNKENDIRMAQRKGISTYYVMSAYDMLLASSAEEIITYAATVFDFVMLGVWLARIYNSPFALYQSEGKLTISSEKEMGFAYFAPLTMCYMGWLLGKLRGRENAKILFSARDGYLLWLLYEKYITGQKTGEFPKSVYFYTSRQAATIGAISTKEDVEEELELIFQNTVGTLGDYLRARFGIDVKEDELTGETLLDIVRKYGKDKAKECVTDRYGEDIFSNAAQERENYINYCEKEGLAGEEKLLLFDMETRGTVYRKLQKLLNKRMELYCFATVGVPNELIGDSDEVHSLFGNFTRFSDNVFHKLEQLFEVVYASPDGQLRKFDDEGNKVFVRGSEYNYSAVKKAQEGIASYFEEMQRCFPLTDGMHITKEVACAMFSLVQPKYSTVRDEVKEMFVFQDGFSNSGRYSMWDNLLGE